ncbi:MAG TPA: hypothetical protein VGX03_27225 [Candidatus Binatia bacterium]|jgi:hypothetical protein|nr:hypothetical protein [Candidatus Binatia bacterium]
MNTALNGYERPTAPLQPAAPSVEFKAFAVGSPGVDAKKTAGDADGHGEMQTATSKSAEE